MKAKEIQIAVLLAFAIFISACAYIVLPEGLANKEVVDGSEFWSAEVINVSKSEAGDLHIDITIRNDSGGWSTMQAVSDKPAVLTTSDGSNVNCDTVFVGTGGHRFAPGFQMRGYTTGKNDDINTQLLYVECKGAEADAGSKLSIDYVSFSGELDDYDPEANRTQGNIELNLDEIATDLTFPVSDAVDGIIQDSGVSITALSDNVITLQDVQRTENGFQFTWQNFNPTKFALKTHIGTPPVIGSDGIIYGPYETLDMVSVPLTPANENMQWTTEVAVPEDITGFYILLSAESKKPRTYLQYAIDITEKE
ncbi:MAG: hypothetical protein WBG94_07710 [Anaerolineales bacterium]